MNLQSIRAQLYFIIGFLLSVIITLAWADISEAIETGSMEWQSGTSYYTVLEVTDTYGGSTWYDTCESGIGGNWGGTGNVSGKSNFSDNGWLHPWQYAKCTKFDSGNTYISFWLFHSSYVPPDPEPCPEAGTPAPDGLAFDGKHANGPFCVEECVATKVPDGDDLALAYKDGDQWKTIVGDLEYTGERCDETPEDETPQNAPLDCDEFQDVCADLCGPGGVTADPCNEETGQADCECGEKPPFPLVRDETTSNIEPDQDKDGIGSSVDGDVDGDGIPNENDVDVDGDGLENESDPDVDGDGISNDNDSTYFPVWGGGDGIGSDPDIDGDGIVNSSDSNMDGDGYGNDDDGDMDGDGYPNDSDPDTDGDGNPNDTDGDVDGDGTDNEDDSSTHGGTGDNGTGDGDGDGDGDGEEEEEDGEPGEVGDPIGDAACPDGQVCLGDGVCQSGESETSADCAGENFIQDRYETMINTIQETGLFSIADGLSGIPGGGTASMSVDLGNWGGVQTFDFSQFSYAWAVLNSVFTVAFAFLGIKIVTLKQA